MEAGEAMIYITGDIHGKAKERFENYMFTKNDIVLICGDFGLPWHNPVSVSDMYQLDWLEKQKAVFAYIDGNHENFSVLNSLPVTQWNNGRVHQIRSNIIHLMRGEIFTINNYSFFCFGGANSIDKMYRARNISWWEEEIYNEAEYNNAIGNLKRYEYKVDVVLTHTAPKQLFLDNPYFIKYAPAINPELTKDKTSDMLTILYPFISYKKWYFGHFHMEFLNKQKKCHCLYKEVEIFHL
ncbi:metallophosphoesterase family protein [Pectinatus brassicae]|nr:metallophosphoesterase [Pectinatus brassicae]